MNRTKQGMTDLMATVQAPPCEAMPCPHFNQCKAEHLACDAFQSYVHNGKLITQQGKYRMVPSRGIYNSIFKRNDISYMKGETHETE